jgi:hypothetical protein
VKTHHVIELIVLKYVNQETMKRKYKVTDQEKLDKLKAMSNKAIRSTIKIKLINEEANKEQSS